MTYNHRSHAIGYVNLSDLGPEYQAISNVGMNDIVFLLGWVRDNADRGTGIAVNPARNVVYVVNVLDIKVTAIDGSNNRVIGTYAAGDDPYVVILDESTGQIFTADYECPALAQVKVRRRG